jgi:hypothetical protein
MQQQQSRLSEHTTATMGTNIIVETHYCINNQGQFWNTLATTKTEAIVGSLE